MSVFFTKRFFASQTENYFKRIIRSTSGTWQSKYFLKKEFQDYNDMKKYHDQRKKEIIASKKHKKIFGLTDYELQDYKVDGVYEFPVNYIDEIKGKIPEDKIRNGYGLDIVSQLNPECEVALFNLPYDITEKDIRDVYSQYGPIEHVEVVDNFLEVPTYAIVTYKATASLLK